MGPNLFRFEQVVIDRMVVPGEPGNYVLGLKDDSGEFIPKYIGRSDLDLRAEMTAKLATMKYPYFKFSMGNPTVAFQTECAQFHNFRRVLENKTHPVKPLGSELKCFLCGL
jgi:hypothetical protein